MEILLYLQLQVGELLKQEDWWFNFAIALKCCMATAARTALARVYVITDLLQHGTPHLPWPAAFFLHDFTLHDIGIS